MLMLCDNCPFGLNLLSGHSLCNFIMFLDQLLYPICMMPPTILNPMTLPLQLYLRFFCLSNSLKFLCQAATDGTASRQYPRLRA